MLWVQINDILLIAKRQTEEIEGIKVGQLRLKEELAIVQSSLEEDNSRIDQIEDITADHENRINEQASRTDFAFEVFEQAGLLEEYLIHLEFAELQNQDPNHGQYLADYCLTFYYLLSNYFASCRVAGPGILQGNVEAFASEAETQVARVVKHILPFIASSTNGVPILGSAVGVLGTLASKLYDNFNEVRFEDRVAKLNSLILETSLDSENFLNEKHFSNMMAKIAITATRCRKDEIIRITTETEVQTSRISSGMKFINDKIEEIRSHIGFKATELCNTDIKNLALKDVTMTITSLFGSYEERVMQNKNLEERLEYIVSQTELRDLKIEIHQKDALGLEFK